MLSSRSLLHTHGYSFEASVGIGYRVTQQADITMGTVTCLFWPKTGLRSYLRVYTVKLQLYAQVYICELCEAISGLMNLY